MVRQVSYDVAGWGVGELVLVDGLVAWHELPRYAFQSRVPQSDVALVDRIRA